MKPSKRQFITAALLASSLGFGGCSPAFWGGAAAGVLGTGAGYEVQSKRQMDRLDDDLRSGRIERREYEQRKEQIERGSIIY
jgi:osmotically-inducible protein OsmY